MIFAEILNDLLNEREKTIKDLSIEANIPYTTICGWLKAGRLPDYNALIKLAKYFEVSADYLLGYENDFEIKDNTESTPQHYSNDEKQLIETYRALSPGKKKALFDMLEISTEIQSKKKA